MALSMWLTPRTGLPVIQSLRFRGTKQLGDYFLIRTAAAEVEDSVSINAHRLVAIEDWSRASLEWIPGIANLGFAGGTICDRCTDAILTRSTKKRPLVLC